MATEEITSEFEHLNGILESGGTLSPRETIQLIRLGGMAIRRLTNERQEVVNLCRQMSHPGVSPAAHELAHKILQLLGDRP